MAASLALLLLTMPSKVKEVHIVYLNEVLQKKDQDDFRDLWALIPKGMMVHYHADICFAPASNSVVIIDESDEHMFSNPSIFTKLTKKAPCICLTATCAENFEKGIER